MNILYYCHILYERIEAPILNILLKIQLILNGINGNIKTMYTLPILRIHPTAKVTLGNGVQFNNKDNVGWYSRCRIQALRNSRLTIGENTGISSSLIFCANSVTIGKNVKIGGGCRIFDTDFHNTKNFKERRTSATDGPKAETRPVTIEDDVFIGTNCIIGKGVTIGSRSIIAAGSVVVKNVPSDEVWGGNPACFIKEIKTENTN